MPEPKAIGDDTSRLRLLDAIGAAGRRPLTVPDLVAETGLTPDETERHLRSLVLEYESDLDVDDDGHLLYRFDPKLKAREDVIVKDRRRRRRQALKRFAMAAFKIWTVTMVVVYAIVYTILLIMFLTAGRQGSSGSSRRSRGGTSWIFWSRRGFGPTFYGDRWDRRQRRQRRTLAKEMDRKIREGWDPYDLTATPPPDEEKPGLVDRVWYWLFGDTQAPSPLEKEKELLTYIRAKQGLVTNADLMALLGVTYDEADTIGTRLVATYEGELELTEDGIPVYRFPNLMFSGTPEITDQVPRLRFLWGIRRQMIALRKHKAIAIPLLNGFNLVLCFFTATQIMPTLGIGGPAAFFGLVLFPGVYSTLFFALGLTRKLREASQAKRFTRDNIRISLYRLLFTRKRPVSVPGDGRQIAAAGLGSWSDDVLREHLDAIALDLRGDVEAAPNGTLTLRADRVIGELKTVEKLRRRADRLRPVGRTIFSSRLDAHGVPEVTDSRPADDALSAQIAELEVEAPAEHEV